MINHKKVKELGIKPDRVRKFIEEIDSQVIELTDSTIFKYDKTW